MAFNVNRLFNILCYSFPRGGEPYFRLPLFTLWGSPTRRLTGPLLWVFPFWWYLYIRPTSWWPSWW